MNMFAQMTTTAALLSTTALLLQDKSGGQDVDIHELHNGAIMQIVTDAAGGDDQHQSISVSVSNDNGEERVRVIVDGEEVTGDRIERRDGKIIVLDENGNEIHTVNTGFTFELDPNQWMGNLADIHLNVQDWRGVKGQEGPLALWTAEEPTEEPKVMIGVTLGTPSAALRKHLKLEEGEGTILNSVSEGLPAAHAGLEAYDIIVAIDGEGPAPRSRIHEALAELEPDDRIAFTVIHEGKRKVVTVYPEPYDAKKLNQAKSDGEVHGVFELIPNGQFRQHLPRLEVERLLAPGDEGPELFRFMREPELRFEEKVPDDIDDTNAARLKRLEKQIDELQSLIEKLAERP